MLANAHIVYRIIFLALAGFLAAFVDAIAGGGGIISLPAYMIVGFPPHETLGTNKFSSTLGTLASTINFAKSGKVDKDILKYLLPCTFIGSILGALAVLRLDPDILKPLVLVLLLGVGIYSLFSKEMGMTDNYTGIDRRKIILGILLAFSLGFYDGFFGPGTGSFIIFGLIKIFGFDYVRASGNAKAMNFTSNIGSIIVFMTYGTIQYLMAIPMALAMIAGAIVGSKIAIREGAKFVKPIFVTMSLAAAGKMLYDMIF